MKNFWVILVLVAVVVVGGLFLLNRANTPSPEAQDKGPEGNTAAPSGNDTTNPSTGSPQASSGQVTPTPAPTPAPATHTVTYTDSGFSPSVVGVKAGDTVTFVNSGTQGMWIASNPHPQHTAYSGFDALRQYSVGESYSFTFTQLGTWGYHNHLRPGDGGSVVVTGN